MVPLGMYRYLLVSLDQLCCIMLMAMPRVCGRLVAYVLSTFMKSLGNKSLYTYYTKLFSRHYYIILTPKDMI